MSCKIIGEESLVMNVEADPVYIIKCAYNHMFLEKLSIKDTLTQVIHLYHHYYLITQNPHFTNLIVYHIQAYLELGFPYGEIEESLNPLLQRILDKKFPEFMKTFVRPSRTVNLSKERINNILGSWGNSSKNSGKKKDVIDDIINRLKNKIPGVKQYHTNLSGKGHSDRCTVLVINDSECYLKSPEGVYYTFKDDVNK